MIVAVLSGKGGAGKTFVAVNLAVAAKESTYIDCDVEEPNGRLFFKPVGIEEEAVYTKLPTFNEELCKGCRKCVDFCRFNALVYIGNKPMVFPEVCHSCGGCKIVCPNGAVSEEERQTGHVESGWHDKIRVVTGELNLGESSGVPVINKAISHADPQGVTIIDCPPGSACPVVESVDGADYCVMVVEPTAFGFHNFKMVYELVSLLHKPCGVVINKMDEVYEPLEEFCRENHIPVLLRISYDEKTAKLCSMGKIVSEEDPSYAEMFQGLLTRIGGALS